METQKLKCLKDISQKVFLNQPNIYIYVSSDYSFYGIIVSLFLLSSVAANVVWIVSVSVVLGNAYLSLFFVKTQDPNTLKQCFSAYKQAVGRRPF